MAVWTDRFDQVLRMNSRFMAIDGPIDPDVSLAKLGVDSLEISELIALIEDEYRMEFPLEDLTPESFATPRTIWTLICSYDPSVATVGAPD